MAVSCTGQSAVPHCGHGKRPPLAKSISISRRRLSASSIAGFFFGADAVRGSLTAQFKTLLGDTGSKAVEAMLAGASSPQSGRLAALTGVVLLLVAALGVIVQLKDAMNTIWGVEEPAEAGAWW